MSSGKRPDLSRREVLGCLGYVALAPKLAAVEPRGLAITMDDAAWEGIPEPFRAGASERLLRALDGMRAALFVTGRNVDSPTGRKILRAWSDRGHVLANHTWSHRVYNASIDPSEFGSDLLRCDRMIRTFAGFRPFFRFPALKEGTTRERRDFLRAFLRAHGYRNGSVTIDTSDWYYDQRLRTRLAADATFDVNRYREPYLAHMWERSTYYDELAVGVLGAPVRHTLLVHFNLINALFLGDLLPMFRDKGWNILNADTAFEDPVFRREPDTVPAGESLIWALAKEAGGFEARLRYPGEDAPYEKAILDRLGL